MSFDVDSLIAQSIKEIEKAESGRAAFEALWAAAQSIVAPINLTLGFVGRVATPTATLETPFFAYYRMPKGWAKTYIERDYINIDPQALRALRHTRSYYWSEYDVEWTEEQIAMAKEAEAHGLKEGLTFPVHSRVGIAGALSFAADTEFRLSTIQHICLEVVGRFTYEHIENLLGPQREVESQTLTDRERDVLTLIAQGKTNWETGTILEISQYSVRDHLKSVSKRLSTSNRTQTIVKAVKLGLIVP